jgi:hypothetical protein
MLNSIKEMIKQKQSLMEASSLIFDDANGLNIEDLIVLGEETTEEPVTEEEMEDDNDKEKDKPEEKEPEAEPESEPETNMMDEPVEDDLPAPEPDEVPAGDNMLDEPIDGPVDGTGEVSPEGDPSIDPIDDILSVSIDLRTNTLNDTLPIPPANAADALPSEDDDSLLSQKVDSGFGGEDDDTSTLVPEQEGELDTTESESEEELSIESKIAKLNNTTRLLQEFRGFRDVGNPERHIEDMDRRPDGRFANSPLGQAAISKDAMDKYHRLMGDLPDEIVDNDGTDSLPDEITDKSEYDKPLTAVQRLRNRYGKECDDILGEECGESDSVIESIENIFNDDIFTEEISLGDGDNSQNQDTPPDANNNGENSVTAAVRDKVSESQPDESTGDDDLSDGLEDDLSGADETVNKSDIFSKLSNLTKNLEDIKKDIISNK